MRKLLWLVKIKIFFFVLTFSVNAAAKIHDVTAGDFAFNPAILTSVEVGDTIRWTWLNGTHTTTSTSVPAGAATWDAPLNSTSKTFEYPVTVAGDYAYKCTFHVLMGMVGSFSASLATGINTDHSTAEIELFPNPVSNKVIVHYSSKDAPLQSIKIYDLSGKIIKEMNINASGPVTDETLDLAELNPGVFFLDFRDSSGRSAVRRIIKN